MPAAKSDLQKILVADDELDVLNLVAHNLKISGYSVIEASDGPSALTSARKEVPSLIVLDLMLPGMSGFEICKALKGDDNTKGIPIIMLTAKTEEVDRIVGFELGADDYVTKPFSPRELVLRIQSVLRRGDGRTKLNESLKVGSITIDRQRHIIQVKGRTINLTATEFKLLSFLAERRGRVQSRDALLNEVWAYENAIDTRTVDTHIRRLREKLGPAGNTIETVRGFGYRISEQKS